MSGPTLPVLMQTFFTDRMTRQMRASPHTIASYRDTFRLLLQFAATKRRVQPIGLSVEDLDSSLITAFLEHLETGRGNSARTRNARLAAIRSFFRFVAIRDPARMLTSTRILAIPEKRHERRAIAYLDREEAAAMLAAVPLTTWVGRRDRVLLVVALQCGLRVSELVQLRRSDVATGAGAHVRCRGKGRKERCTPLRRETAALIVAWLRERDADVDAPLFPTRSGTPMSRDAVERLVAKYVRCASSVCTSLKAKRVTPHVLRHTAAMDLLQHGVDRTVIALWLGHESVETTQMYLHSDLRLKEAALARAAPLGVKVRRYQPTDKLLAFLEGL